MKKVILVVCSTIVACGAFYAFWYPPCEAKTSHTPDVPKYIPFDMLAQALILQESKGNANAVGDNGKSRGWLQIQKAYWKDAMLYGDMIEISRGKVIWVEKGWTYDEVVKNKEKSIQCVRWYCQRYASKAYGDGNKVDWNSLARLHNGGPGLMRSHATDSYASDIREILKGLLQK